MKQTIILLLPLFLFLANCHQNQQNSTESRQTTTQNTTQTTAQNITQTPAQNTEVQSPNTDVKKDMPSLTLNPCDKAYQNLVQAKENYRQKFNLYNQAKRDYNNVALFGIKSDKTIYFLKHELDKADAEFNRAKTERSKADTKYREFKPENLKWVNTMTMTDYICEN